MTTWGTDRPEGYTGDVPLGLRARLDSDRTVELKYCIGSGDWRGARLPRSKVSTAVGRKAAELHDSCTDFLHRWGQEATPPNVMPSSRS
ncbi:hypothetical protein ABZ484_26005 [Streptomyces sp. NPDC006393]|uniref:hypothetical protein n=1 Tax=Streptomyces sp. NPDC006393 TaxID=3156763 RepID=UPI0033ED77FC